MQCEIREMADTNPRVSDTLPRRGHVNEGNTFFFLLNKYFIIILE